MSALIRVAHKILIAGCGDQELHDACRDYLLRAMASGGPAPSTEHGTQYRIVLVNLGYHKHRVQWRRKRWYGWSRWRDLCNNALGYETEAEARAAIHLHRERI